MDDLNKEICRWRNRIDKIDLQLVKLLSKRAKCADEIGKLKLKLGIEAYSPEREKEVMHNISTANPGPLTAKSIRRLFERIIDESRSIEHVTMSEKKKKAKNNKSGE
ncbi:MAG: chorismate mutase [Bacteroidota bacterium]